VAARGGLPRGMAGQTVLIVGYGSIGEMVERLLVPFGVKLERVAAGLRRRP
jgi:lactate dehydrogenase-like 2-hydroxyacid dehydrogenase